MGKTKKSPRTKSSRTTTAVYKVKKLTPRRIQMISEFLTETIDSSDNFGEYFGSGAWMDKLSEFLLEPKYCKSTKMDILAWVKDDCFKELIGQVKEAAAKRTRWNALITQFPRRSMQQWAINYGNKLDALKDNSRGHGDWERDYFSSEREEIAWPTKAPPPSPACADYGGEEEEPTQLELEKQKIRHSFDCIKNLCESLIEVALNRQRRKETFQHPIESMEQWAIFIWKKSGALEHTKRPGYYDKEIPILTQTPPPSPACEDYGGEEEEPTLPEFEKQKNRDFMENLSEALTKVVAEKQRWNSFLQIEGRVPRKEDLVKLFKLSRMV